MAKNQSEPIPKKRDPKAKRGPHKGVPISEDDLLLVAASLKEVSSRLRALAEAVALSKAKVARLKSWKRFSGAIKAAMFISGKFNSDFESQDLENVPGFGKPIDDEN